MLFFLPERVIFTPKQKEVLIVSPTKVTEVTLPNGEKVPVHSAASAPESPETETLRASAARAGAQAVAYALDHNVPVTVMKDGRLVKINPDRTETVIEAEG